MSAQTNISGIGSELLANWGTGLDLDGLMRGQVVDIINFLIAFSALVAVVVLIASGYMFMTSAGDPDKVEKAKRAITASIVGLIIIFLAQLIVVFVVGLRNPGGGGSKQSGGVGSMNVTPTYLTDEYEYKT